MDTATHPLIDRIERSGSRLRVTPGSHLRSRWLRGDFTVEYERDVDLEALPLAVAIAPFALNVAPVAWISGERYSLDVLDADLARSLAQIRNAFRTELYPDTAWQGEIHADRLVDTPGRTQPGAPVGALFSGGVDSICTSMRHTASPQVLVSVWGADVAFENEAGWNLLRRQALEYGERYGHANAFVRSNFKTVLDRPVLDRRSAEIPGWWGYVQNGMGLTGLCMPLLYARGSDRLLIASSHTADFSHPWGSHPAIDDAIRVAGIQVEHDGYELSRQEKVSFIIGTCRLQGLEPPTLRVCYANPKGTGENCCRCEKCLRTITGLVLDSADPVRYGFDTSAAEALGRLRTRVRLLLLHMGANEAWMWSDLQQRANRSLPAQASEGARSLAEWVRTADFAAYRRRSAPLWNAPRWLKGRARALLALVRDRVSRSP